MARTSFRGGIHEILSLMTNYDNLAIMCAEAVPWHCHRRMIADYLTLVEGISVFDIIIGSKKQPELHQVTSFANLTDSKTNIIYPEKVNENRIQLRSIAIMTFPKLWLVACHVPSFFFRHHLTCV